LTGPLAALTTFSVSTCSTALGSRLTNPRHVIPYALLVHYFIYSPLWLFISIKRLAKASVAMLKGKEIKGKDWKV